LADPADTTDPASSAQTAVAGPADAAAPEVSEQELAAVAPEVMAGSLSEYFQAWGRRIRNGESGALPIIVGLIIIVIFFQLEQSQFLSAGNLVNLFVLATVYTMFGAAEIFALILSEIDLSVGYVGAVGGFVIIELLNQPVNFPWWLAIIGGLVVGLLIGLLQGSLITRLGLPSFIVTLGGLLGFQGVMLELANIDKTAVGGVITIPSGSPILGFVQSNMSPALSWIVLVVAIGLYAAVTIIGHARRRRQGLTAPPLSITLLTVALAAVGGIVLVLICNTNRGLLTTLDGMPWVIPITILIIVIYTWLLNRTRPGRYVYAIGGNPEAARRAGVNVPWVRTLGFMLCSFTAVIAGLIYASRLGSQATDIDGGSLVLYAVAAAVIGGASLFGGKGKPLNALLGGVVLAAVFNGLGLMGISAAGVDIATAIVLIAAVTLDSLVRRRATVR
jgi:D-xylose transport system permease protein